MNPSAAVAGAVLVDPDAAMDHKTALNQFCQRYCKRPVTKQDIVYVVNRFGNQYQSIVKLNCFSGQEYAGHLSMSSKEAEKSAAQQAFVAYSANLEALGPKEDVPKKKKPSAAKLSPAEAAAKKESQAAGEEEEEDNPAITAKTKLNSLCMKIAKRYLQKGETVYESLKVTGGYQATVKLGALPGEWAQRCWAGEVCSTKQKAEQSAAEIALSQVLGDSTLCEEAAKPKERVPKAGKGREGMGKWVWQGSEEDEEEEEIPRARVGEGKIACTVVEWKGAYGWVRAAEALDHPAASFRGGKIYVHKSDLEGGLAELEAGAQVEMFVYEDPSGLGGEEVTAV